MIDHLDTHHLGLIDFLALPETLPTDSLTTSKECRVYTRHSIARDRTITAAETEQRPPGDGVSNHLLLERVAAGDALAFGTLYDVFAAETYAICLYKFAMPSSADKAMVKIWIFIWSHAAALNEQTGSTKSIVLSTAWAVTSQRRRSPSTTAHPKGPLGPSCL